MEHSDNGKSVHSHEEDELADEQWEHGEKGSEDDRQENQDDEDDEDSEPEFDCQPVRKKSRLDYSTIIPGLEKPRISNGFRDLAISLNAGRNRRPGTLQAAIQGFSTGYVDQDTSGTYDPKLVRATPPPTPISRPIRERARHDENGQPRPNKRKRIGYTFPVKLTLKSKKGLDYLKSIPEGPYSSGSEAEDETSDLEHDSGYNSPVNRLRRSRRVKTSTTHSKYVPVDQIPVVQTQGCKGCQELGEAECSVIKNKYSWPCDACVDAGIECEMIIPFEFKTGCSRCKRKRTKCPFRDDAGRGVDRCSNCEAVDEPCIAGPVPKALEYKYQDVSSRPSMVTNTKSKTSKSVCKEISLHSSNPTPQPDPARPQRVYVSCNQCRETGGRCRLKRNQDGPCANCKKAGETCKFVYAPTRIPFSTALLSGPNGQIKKSFTEDHTESSRPHTYEDNTRQIYNEILSKKRYNTTKGKTNPKSKYRSNSRIVPSIPERPRARLIGTTSGIQHITITTSFCHPIRFHYAPDPDNKFPCSWCDSPVFGLWGHSPKEVEVIPYGKNGNEEISGGHYEDGVEQTKMCCNCTLERMSIMYCEGHSMKAIEGLDPRTLDLGAIGQSLVALAQDDHDGAELVKRVKWCSICVSPAEYSCNSQEEGCGMHLCQTCNDLLTRLQKSWTGSVGLNLMDELVKLWKADLWKRGDMGELRADTEFLLTTGELSVRMNLGMEMSSFEDGNVGMPKEGSSNQSFNSSQSSQGSIFSVNGRGKESQDTAYSGVSSQNNYVHHSSQNSLPIVHALPRTPGPRKVPGSFGSPNTPSTNEPVSLSRPRSSLGLSSTPKSGPHLVSGLDISPFNTVYPNQHPAKRLSSSAVPKIVARTQPSSAASAIEPRKFTIPSSPKPTFNPALIELHAQARANPSATSSVIGKSTKVTQELTRRTRPSHLPQKPSANSMSFMNAKNASVNAKKQNNTTTEVVASVRKSVKSLAAKKADVQKSPRERSRVNALKAMDTIDIYDDVDDDDERVSYVNNHSAISRPASSSSVVTIRSSSTTNGLPTKKPARKAPPQNSPSISLLSSDDEDILPNTPKLDTPAARNIQDLVKKPPPPSTGFRFLDEVDVEMEMSSRPNSSASSPASRVKKPQKPAPTNLRFLDEVDVEMEMGSRPGSSSSKKAKAPATNFRFLDEVDVKTEIEGLRERKGKRNGAKENGGRWNGLIPVGAEVIELGGESEDEDGGEVELVEDEEEDA